MQMEYISKSEIFVKKLHKQEGMKTLIQDIFPNKLDNSYCHLLPKEDDRCFVFKNGQILLRKASEDIDLPMYGELKGYTEKSVHIFNINDEPYFLVDLSDEFDSEVFEFQKVRGYPRKTPKVMLFAELTAYHLYLWYRDTQYCGRCGKPAVHDEQLRMMRCPDCGNMMFPKIAPAIIVAVRNKDKVLATRYNGREYKGYALIAGFNEIGETLEDTVRREVFEEAGVHVKNIKYYGNQPWGIDLNMLVGFTAELDGSEEIKFDHDELSYAQWCTREELAEEIKFEDRSLTNDMITAFINKRI